MMMMMEEERKKNSCYNNKAWSDTGVVKKWWLIKTTSICCSALLSSWSCLIFIIAHNYPRFFQPIQPRKEKQEFNELSVTLVPSEGEDQGAYIVQALFRID